MKPRIYVLFVFDLDGKCKFIKNKTLQLLKKYVFSCHVGWVNRRLEILYTVYRVAHSLNKLSYVLNADRGR